MNLLKTLSKKVGGLALPALNWYKIGAVILVLAAWTVFVDQRAKHKCELNYEQQKAEQAEKKTEAVVKHVEDRLPVIAKKERESAELRGSVGRTAQQLEEYVYENENRNNPNCDLSDDEFNGLRDLIKQSQDAAK